MMRWLPRSAARWRRRAHSFGGFLTIGVVVGAIVLLAVLVVRNPLLSISDDPLLGEAITLGPPTHVNDPAQLQIVPGVPPAGGPMFPDTVRQGVYADPVADGSAIHSLEHGMVWISYRPDLAIAPTVAAALEDLADEFSRDVIVSPRPGNEMPLAAVSWGRLLRLDQLDVEQLRSFVRTNRNRSPEAGIR